MNKQIITVHDATPADIDTMWRWGEDNWQLWGDEKNKWFSKKTLKRWIENPEDDIVLVTKEGSALVGMCLVHIIKDWAICFGLFVHEKYRGQKIGKQMLDMVEKKLPKLGVRNYSLLVETKNLDAMKFYMREGFYKGFDFNLMTKDL